MTDNHKNFFVTFYILTVLNRIWRYAYGRADPRNRRPEKHNSPLPKKIFKKKI